MLNHILDNVFNKIFSKNVEMFFFSVPFVDLEQNLRKYRKAGLSELVL